MLKQEKTIKSESIFKGKIINLRIDTVELPNSKNATREVVEHPGAAAIVPIREDKKIIMVRQFRKPVEDFLLEIPAGKIDVGEKPITCAKRELKEETGYESKNIHLLNTFYSSPGFSNEVIHIYVATDLIRGEACPDENEYIQLESYTLDELLDMIYKQKLKDSKTIISILSIKTFLFDYFQR